MENSIFRKKSLEQISSPEELNDYLHVTGPSVWLVLTAVILLLAGMLIWSSVASFDSFATGTDRPGTDNTKNGRRFYPPAVFLCPTPLTAMLPFPLLFL
ncbi:MAG: hypothetical protein IJU30_01970 [Lachnospiraceae bacterium]|nr:hypothetical protein [Lachnospiraceae bacterium]